MPKADFWGLLRTIGLWILIVFVGIDFAQLAIHKEWIILAFWASIAFVVILWETWGILIGLPTREGGWKRRTISTVHKEYIQRLWWAGYLHLVWIGTALFPGLLMHLSVWGGMFSR